MSTGITTAKLYNYGQQNMTVLTSNSYTVDQEWFGLRRNHISFGRYRSAADKVVLVSDEEPASRFWFHRKSWEYHSVHDWSCFSGTFTSGTALNNKWSHLTWCAVIKFNVIIDIPDPCQSGMWYIPSALQPCPWFLSNPNILDSVCTRVAVLTREQMVVWLFIILSFDYPESGKARLSRRWPTVPCQQKYIYVCISYTYQLPLT